MSNTRSPLPQSPQLPHHPHRYHNHHPEKIPAYTPNPPTQQAQSPPSILKPRDDADNEALGRAGFGEGKVRQGVRKNEQILDLQKAIEEKNTNYITI